MYENTFIRKLNKVNIIAHEMYENTLRKLNKVNIIAHEMYIPWGN